MGVDVHSSSMVVCPENITALVENKGPVSNNVKFHSGADTISTISIVFYRIYKKAT
jgi:hypothetical protein